MSGTFLEFPLKFFIQSFPDMASVLPRSVHHLASTDSRYIIRVSEDGTFEIGYPEDNWTIK